MKRTHLIAAIVGLTAIAATSSPAHARLYMMMHGSNVYPAVATPMPAGPMSPMISSPTPPPSPMMAMRLLGRMSVPMAGGFDRPHVGVNVYPDAAAAMPTMQRDPMDPPVLFDPTGRHPDGPNLYQYVRSNPVRWQDPSGLQIMICTTPGRWYLLGGKHAYLWDDRKNQSCGESGSSGSGGDYKNGYPDGGQPGPQGKGHTCTAVPGSNGKEDCVMNWCKEHMNEGAWVPFIYDCHSRAEKALKECCLSDKGVPHPRF